MEIRPPLHQAGNVAQDDSGWRSMGMVRLIKTGTSPLILLNLSE